MSPMDEQANKVEVFQFVVDGTPYCVWGHELRDIQSSFLEDFDPKYFEFSANAFAEKLHSSEKANAHLAIRATYGHAMETLFAVLCATVQAPGGVLAWLLRKARRELAGFRRA